MNIKEDLVSRYKKAKMLGVPLCDMDASSIAGYYIESSAEPILDLSLDVKCGRIPAYMGNACKIILVGLAEKEVTYANKHASYSASK